MFEKSILSIDIGTQNIKLAVGKQQGNIVVVDRLLMTGTPANSYLDGKLMNMELLKEEIARTIANEKIKAKRAVCTIESTAIIRRDIELPTVKPEELDTMIQYEIEQYLPISLEDYIIEYKIQEEFVEENVKKSRISVAALPKSIAEDYLQLLRGLKLVPVALDINSNVLSKLFGSPKVQINNQKSIYEKTVAYIDIGYSSMNLVIVKKGIMKFNRLMSFGGYEIDINIANAFNLDVLHAERRKIEDAELTDPDRQGTGSKAMLDDILRTSAEHWVQELQRMFQYYTSRSKDNRIDEVCIYGGSSNIKGLAEYLQNLLNYPVNSLKAVNTVKLGKASSPQDLEYYLNAVGAIIRK